MQKDSKLFDDFARMASNATGVLFDMKQEIESSVASQTEKFLLKMQFVSREEFDVAREMASKARAENEALSARLDALEATSKKKTAKK